MPRERANTFFGGAAVLAAGIAIVKVLGALYKIPIVSILGSGYADFSNAYYIYSLLINISTAGLPVALSKLVSEANAVGNRRQVDAVFRTGLVTFLLFGAASFCVMFFGAKGLAGLMNDPLAAPGIRVLAPAVICVCGLSAFRGYAQGHGRMAPTAVSQIIEAACKLVLGLGLALYLVKIGRENHIAAAGAIVGVTIGTVLALAFMAVDFLRNKRSEPLGRRTDKADSTRRVLGRLLTLALPITISSSTVSIITLIDSAIVQGRLQDALGMTLEQSRNLFSSYSGVMTVYALPSAFMIALTASIIPAVSARRAVKDRAGAAKIVGSSLRVTALLAFPAGVGLCVMGTPIVKLLFHSLDPELSGPLLSILGIAAIFVCVMQVTNAVLQAHGFVFLPIVTTAIGGMVMIIFDYITVGIPSINIFGSPIGTVICYAIISILNLMVVKRVVRGCPSVLKLFFKPAVAAVGMGLVALGVYKAVSGRLGNTIGVLAAIVLAAAVYLVLVLALKAISRDDLALMPKGEKLARILRIR